MMRIRKLFGLPKKKCDIEVHLDTEDEIGMKIFWVHDNRKKTHGSVEFGDVVIDLDKKGNITGFEIMNADMIDVKLDEEDIFMGGSDDEKG